MTTEAYTLWLRLYDARMADWKTNEEQLAKVAAIIEADREEVAEQERAAIVAWLRKNAEINPHLPDARALVLHFSKAVEDGAHHRKATA